MGNSASQDCQIMSIMCCAGADDLDTGARNRASRYVDEKRENYSLPTMEIRNSFVTVPMVHLKPVKNHTHGASAADRSSGSIMVSNIANHCGHSTLYYQGSASDVRNDRTISRNYHWVKDLNAPAVDYEPRDSDLIAMIDVDYYVDMNDFLMNNFRPVVLYTFQPQTLGCSNGEFSFCFDDHGRVVYDVSGGSGYKHQVWHYIGDSIKITKKFWGFTYEMKTFALEKRAMGPHHQLVLFAPIASFHGLAAWAANKIMDGNYLNRLDPRVGDGFLRMQVQTNKGLEMHTGKTFNHTCAAIPKHVDDEIASVARVSKTFTISMVKQKLNDISFPGATLLHEYHLSKNVQWGPKVAVVDPYVRSYEYVKTLDDLDESSKPSMVSFMNPIVDAAYCPTVGKNNDRRGVEKRITELQKPAPEPNAFLIKVMEEFIGYLEKVLTREKKLEPVDVEEVYFRQNKPSQQRILERAEYEQASDSTSTFMKREAYQSLNDPRIISQINGVDKRDYARYMYALADAMKKLKWYASGRTNDSIARRVAEIAELALFHITNTDFSRLDGTINALIRLFEQLLMVALFDKTHHADMLRLMKKQFGLCGKTSNGVCYNSGCARCSGSGETSSFNTLINAFVAYLAHRLNHKEPDEAWAGLGTYLGDDGITADVPQKCYERAAKMVGLNLTADIVKRGEMGVTFLARCYGPDVWFGNENSCCSIARTLSKFHTTVHMPSNISPTTKLCDKAYALWLSDSETPIVGQLVSKVVRLSKMKEDNFKNLNGVWNLSPAGWGGNYLNYYDDWMVDLMVSQLSEFDYDAFREWIVGVKSLKQVLNIPQFNNRPEPTMKPGIVHFEGDLRCTFGPHPEDDPRPQDSSPAKPNNRRQRKPRASKAPTKQPAKTTGTPDAGKQKKSPGKGKTPERNSKGSNVSPPN